MNNLSGHMKSINILYTEHMESNKNLYTDNDDDYGLSFWRLFQSYPSHIKTIETW